MANFLTDNALSIEAQCNYAAKSGITAYEENPITKLFLCQNKLYGFSSLQQRVISPIKIFTLN